MQIVSVVLILLIFTAGLAQTFFSPVDEIPYENRPAEKLIDFNISAYSDQSFQSSMENALADQVHMAIKAKKLYNIIDAGTALPIINAFLESNDAYIKYKDINFYRDMLVLRPESLHQNKPKLDKVIETFNSYQSSCSEVDFYAYYIESDHDIDFVSGEKSGFYEYIADSLEFPEENISRLKLDSFEDYSKYFLKTDHHWNNQGSYSAYMDICKMMGFDAMVPAETYTRENCYFGTRSAGIEGLKPEDFSVYLFDYPDMNMSYCGMIIDDYGQQSLFAVGAETSVSYGWIFGIDGGEVIFENSKPGEKLLIMGDSYDNPLLKVLASHFGTTYSVDLRAYETDAGSGFDMETYIAENNIDKVLFVGTLEYFTGTSW